MTEEQLRRLYAEGVLRPAGSSRESCPDAEALRAVAEGRATEERRLESLEHVGGCAPCQRDLALLRQIAGTSTSAAATAHRGVPAWFVTAAAAVVVVSVVGVLWMRSPADPVFRGDGDSVTLVAPSGAVAASSAGPLTWRSVLGALRYEVELLDSEGTVVFDASATDTVLALPPNLRPFVSYGWRVSAVLPGGTRSESALGSFTILPD